MTLEFGLPYTIINVKSGTALDLDDNNNKYVVGFPIDGNTNQQWILEDAGDGFVRIKNLNGLGKYLCIDGNAKDGAPAICSAHQQTWRIIPESGDPDHLRISFSGINWVIDLANGQSAPDTYVQIWESQGSADNQVWIFKHLKV